MEIRLVRWGVLFSGLSILMGFVLGGLFGAFEHPMQDWLKQQGETVLVSVYQNDVKKLEAVADKAWHYFIRAHLHGGGIGSAALALCLVLSGLKAARGLRRVTATLLGLGALGYSSFWLLAGLRAPVLGGTGLAKESLRLLAVPSAGFLLIGVVITLWMVVWNLFITPGTHAEEL